MVADPGFPGGGNLLCGQVFPQSCMKMKEIGYFVPYLDIITKVGKARGITADSASYTPSTFSIISSIPSYT